MKKMKYFALSVVFLCGAGLFSACTVENDNPAVSPTEQEAVDNREVLINHIESDAKTIAENLCTESFNVTSQAYAQLLALIKLDKNFITNMKTLFSAISDNRLSISAVEKNSELAKMGYLAYVTVNNGGFCAQIIFDGKGGSRLLAADDLEFIFPANVTGIGTTLFKLIIKNSDECYQSVSMFNNLKRLACINRLPKSVTMTLNGLIGGQELTLSETLLSLELPQDKDSEFVNFETGSFKIFGKQSTYLNAGDESALDYSLSMEDDKMLFDYGFSRNGMSVLSCMAEMTLPQKENFLGQMSKNILDIADLQAFTIRILDDLTLTGTISDGAAFAKEFTPAVKNRQLASSADELKATVESLNNSCLMQLYTNQMTMPETMKFCIVKKDNLYTIEPGLKDLRNDDFVPVSQLVDRQAIDDFNKPFEQSFTPAGSSAGSLLEFYSVFMQMMPMNR